MRGKKKCHKRRKSSPQNEKLTHYLLTPVTFYYHPHILNVMGHFCSCIQACGKQVVNSLIQRSTCCSLQYTRGLLITQSTCITQEQLEYSNFNNFHGTFMVISYLILEHESYSLVSYSFGMYTQDVGVSRDPRQ